MKALTKNDHFVETYLLEYEYHKFPEKNYSPSIFVATALTI